VTIEKVDLVGAYDTGHDGSADDRRNHV